VVEEVEEEEEEEESFLSCVHFPSGPLVDWQFSLEVDG